MNNYAIILAAGRGERMHTKTPKCFIKIKDKFIYEFSLNTFCSIHNLKKIFLVVPKEYIKTIKVKDPRVKIIAGGRNRNESFENAMKEMPKMYPMDIVVVHDAARVLTKKQDINRLLSSKEDFGTLCYLGRKNSVDFRIKNFNIQTPQFCRYFVYKSVVKPNPKGKDLISYLKLNPLPKNMYIAIDKDNNFKITFKRDLAKVLKRLK